MRMWFAAVSQLPRQFDYVVSETQFTRHSQYRGGKQCGLRAYCQAQSQWRESTDGQNECVGDCRHIVSEFNSAEKMRCKQKFEK